MGRFRGRSARRALRSRSGCRAGSTGEEQEITMIRRFLFRKKHSLFSRQNAEQGIASKTLGLLREMTVRRAKMGKKDLNLANFPVIFPAFRESAAPRTRKRRLCTAT
jgi:hypothetical protein